MIGVVGGRKGRIGLGFWKWLIMDRYFRTCTVGYPGSSFAAQYFSCMGHYPLVGSCRGRNKHHLMGSNYGLVHG